MSNLRKRINIIIFGTNTFWGKAFDVALLVCIMLSILALMLESVSGINLRWETEIFIMEWVLTILFTLEYFCRIWVTPKPKTYILSFFGLIDLFSILPTYLELAVSGVTAFGILRAARLLRVFRVLKLVRFMGESAILLKSIKASLGKITVFLSYVIISCTIIGATMYVVEGPENGFTSIPRGVYWAVVTLTTVGYGDISPATPLGQFLAMILMVTGYGVIAVPTGLVTADIVKSMNDAEKKQNCSSCSTPLAHHQAKFCHHCGTAV